jgi:hypothetical protein
MVAYITDVDLASYLRTTIAAGTADLVVGLTNDLITELIGNQLDNDGKAPPRVRAIGLEVAARAWRNPEGYSSISTEIDDFTVTKRREGDALTMGGVFLTPGEEAYLRGLLGIPTVRSFRLKVPSVHY